jgi:hypothetical protein
VEELLVPGAFALFRSALLRVGGPPLSCSPGWGLQQDPESLRRGESMVEAADPALVRPVGVRAMDELWSAQVFRQGN